MPTGGFPVTLTLRERIVKKKISVVFDTPDEVVDIVARAYKNGQRLGYDKGSNGCYYMTPDGGGCDVGGRCAVGVLMKEAGYQASDLARLNIDNSDDLSDVLEAVDMSIEFVSHEDTVRMMRLMQLLHDDCAKHDVQPEFVGRMFSMLKPDLAAAASNLEIYDKMKTMLSNLNPSF